MKQPFWFKIIKSWKEMGKGDYGVTFPFLIGGISRLKKIPPGEELVKDTFTRIISEPVQGYYCEVRWCGNIEEPVVSINDLKHVKNVAIQAQFEEESGGEVSLAFTRDLMGMFGLDCTTREECIEKLKVITLQRTSKGEFSKNGGEYTSFTDGDIEYLNRVEKL